MIASSYSTHLDPLVSSQFAARVQQALTWVQEQGKEGLAALEPGTIKLDGDNLYVNVIEVASTVAPSEKNYEVHKTYADIHVCILGAERILVVPQDALTPQGSFDEAQDFGLLEGEAPATSVVLLPGDYCITLPGEAHKPALYVDAPAALKKLCIKVACA